MSQPVMPTPWRADAWPVGWLTTITVIRGRDPDQRVFLVGRVLVGWRSTGDSDEWEDAPYDTAVLYLEPGAFAFDRDDLINVPPGHWAGGRWQIDGSPMPGQMGLEVRLRRRI